MTKRLLDEFFAISCSLFVITFIQPANAANLLFSDDFESGNLKKWTGGSSDSITKENVHDGQYALKRNEAQWWGSSAFLSKESRRIYLSFWWYFPVGFNWSDGDPAGRHFWRLSNAQGDQYQYRQFDTGSPINTQNSFEMIAFWDGANGRVPVYRPGAILMEGKWFQFEIFIQLNAPGQSDGIVRLWIDGQQKINSAAQNFGTDTLGFNMLRLLTNYDHCVSGTAGACYWYMDEVEVWDDMPVTVSVLSTTRGSRWDSGFLRPDFGNENRISLTGKAFPLGPGGRTASPVFRVQKSRNEENETIPILRTKVLKRP